MITNLGDILSHVFPAKKEHRDGPKYLYYEAGTITTRNSGSQIKGKSEVHTVYRRIMNLKRWGKQWK